MTIRGPMTEENVVAPRLGSFVGVSSTSCFAKLRSSLRDYSDALRAYRMGEDGSVSGAEVGGLANVVAPRLGSFVAGSSTTCFAKLKPSLRDYRIRFAHSRT